MIKKDDTQDLKIKKKNAAKATQRKATPAFFNATEKSKEVSILQKSETAEVENHYVNGAMKQTKVSVNRGK